MNSFKIVIIIIYCVKPSFTLAFLTILSVCNETYIQNLHIGQIMATASSMNKYSSPKTHIHGAFT